MLISDKIVFVWLSPLSEHQDASSHFVLGFSCIRFVPLDTCTLPEVLRLFKQPNMRIDNYNYIPEIPCKVCQVGVVVQGIHLARECFCHRDQAVDKPGFVLSTSRTHMHKSLPEYPVTPPLNLTKRMINL